MRGLFFTWRGAWRYLEAEDLDHAFFMNFETESILYGLLFDCPFGQELPGCPFHEIRQLPFEKRYDLAQEMSEQEIDRWLAQHRKCLKSR